MKPDRDSMPGGQDEPRCILVIDDDELDREWIRAMIGRCGADYRVDSVGSLAEAAAALATGRYACVLVDHELEGESGSEVLALLGGEAERHCPAVLLTQHDSDLLIVDAIRRGFSDYLPKSRLDRTRLCHVIDQAITREEEARTRFEAEKRLMHLVEHLEREQFSLLTESTRRAQEEARAKTMFLANMCHEVRTPLSTVTGLAQLLARTRLDDEQRRLVGNIDLACKALLAIVNDVLDLSKLDHGQIEIDSGPLGLGQLCEDMCGIVREQCSLNGVVLELSIAPELPATIVADRTRLHQIVLNFLSNAAKFTTSGTIGLSVTGVALADGQSGIRFAVSDSGIGIAQDDLARLFEPFTQADASTTRRFGGTGLGLSIARGLAEAMGGAVDASSEVGRGSVFWVDLPLVEAHPMPLAAVEGTAVRGAALDGVRLLLVDDCEINLEIACELLQHEGAEVRAAMNGQEALDVLSRDPHWAELVLLDLQMPVLGGHDTCRHIDAMMGKARPAVLIMTAGASGDTRALLDDGLADGIVGKPFALDQLAGTIAATLERRRRAPGAPVGRGLIGERPWPELGGLDTATARATFGNDLELLHIALSRLLDDVAQLRDGQASEPAAIIDWHLALVRSNAAFVGAHELGRAAAETILARESADRDCVAAGWRAVCSAVERLEIDLAAMEAAMQLEAA